LCLWGLLNRAQVNVIDIHDVCFIEYWRLLDERLLDVGGFEQGLNPATTNSTCAELPGPTSLPDSHEVLLLEAFHLQKQFTNDVVVHWLLLLLRLLE
jgi:hypothetical protein